MPFDLWREHVNLAAYTIIGLVLDDLAAYPIDTLYQQNLSPHQAAMIVIENDPLGHQILKLQELNAAEIRDLDT